MTFKEELGFEITKVFFNDYNEELKEEEKAFSKEFLKVEDELKNIGKNLIEFEKVLDSYIEKLKAEYFKAGTKMTELVYNSDVKEALEELGA
nr:MAG TPA: hypothetical protein [Caudoviricetes sp.]